MYLTWSVHLAKKLVYGYATKKKKGIEKMEERLKRRLKTNQYQNIKNQMLILLLITFSVLWL